jgi:predicted NUDIX family NTP pyrophosphohydrolase
MTRQSRLAGVATWVLRPGPTSTDVLLVRAPGREAAASDAPIWGPVRGEVGEDETEVAAALRAFDAATGLAERRVYASPVAIFAPGRGLQRVGMFVAIVPRSAEPAGTTERGDRAWVPVREAAAQLVDPGDRAALEEVDARFVRVSPDESLRVA